MSVVEMEKLVFSLPINERAKLADRIIESLPDDFIDEEEMELALLRDKEMDEDPSTVLTHEEFFNFFKRRREADHK